MTVFSAVFTAVAISAAQDLFELVAPSDSRVRLLEIDLAQYSDFADAEAEILPINIFRGHTVSGSGGASVTPANLNPYGRAAGATVERNNTTVATTSGTLLWATGWHLQAGFICRPTDYQSGSAARHAPLRAIGGGAKAIMGMVNPVSHPENMKTARG